MLQELKARTLNSSAHFITTIQRFKVLILTSSGHFINDGNNIIMSLIYAFMVSPFGFSTLLIGILIGAFNIISAFASPVVSYLADRTGNPLRVMGLGILLWGIGLIFLGISIAYFDLNILLVSLSVVFCGFSSAFYHPLGGTAVSMTYGGNAGSALGMNGSFGSIGRALYPTLLLFLFDVLGHSTLSMFYTLIIISLISIGNALPALLAKPPENNIVKKESSSSVTATQSAMFFVFILTFITFLRSAFTVGVTNFLPTLLVLDFHYVYGSDLGFILTVTLAPPILGQPLLGYLTDKYDRRLLYGLSNIGSAISFLLFLTYPSVIWLMVYGFFTYSLFPLTISLIGDLVPKQSSNLSSGIVWGIGSSGGGAFGPILVGLLSGSIGLILSLLIMSILGFISGILVVLIPKSTKRSKVALFG